MQDDKFTANAEMLYHGTPLADLTILDPVHSLPTSSEQVFATSSLYHAGIYAMPGICLVSVSIDDGLPKSYAIYASHPEPSNMAGHVYEFLPKGFRRLDNHGIEWASVMPVLLDAAKKPHLVKLTQLLENGLQAYMFTGKPFPVSVGPDLTKAVGRGDLICLNDRLNIPAPISKLHL